MSTPTLPLTGGCGCGAVRFEITEPPVRAAYCHCTRCQRRTGTAASPGLFIAGGSFRLLSGAELIGGWAPEGGYEKCFCTSGGSALFSRDPETKVPAAIRMGALDQDPGIRPSMRQFVGNAAPWEPIPDDGLPRYEGRRPD